MTKELIIAMNLAVEEMVDTVANSHYRLVNPLSEGNLGKAVNIDDTGRFFRVELAEPALVFIVRRNQFDWTVSFKGASATAVTVEEAAREAYETGKGSNVSKNFPLF